MKIAVVGSREFKHKSLMQSKLNAEFSNRDTLISGGARGVDKWAEELITILESGLADYKIYKQIFLPDWDKYGKSAGFKRNKLIVQEADKILAFWDGKSKGTKHSIDLAISMNKPIDIYIRSVE